MNQRITRWAVTSATILAAALGGCGSDEEAGNAGGSGGAGGTGGTGGSGGGTELPPAYALASSVFGDAGTATYVHVLDTLDVESVAIADASEHSGFATIGARDGKLFVGDGAAPVITRYTVGADGGLTEDDRVSFAGQGLQTAPLYFNTFVDADSAYMQHEQNKRVFWNPGAMEISGSETVGGLDAERDGLRVVAGYSDRSARVRDGYVFQPYHWTDANYYRFAGESQIAVFDAETDSLVELLDAPCPGLDFVTSDEAGNLYFSNWVFAAAAPVLDETAPATCAVRIKAGEQAIDTEWTRSLNDLVGGRQTAAFRYLGDSVGIVAVLHDEDMEIDENTEPSAITLGSNWRLWQVNLETGTGAPVEGLDKMAGGYYAFLLDGRLFLLLPSADYAKTSIYELQADGSATRLYEVPGWAYQFVKVR